MRGYSMHKDDYRNRLRRIEGQVRGLQRMVDEDEYCVDILTQIVSVTKALQGVGLGLLDEHLRKCVRDAAESSRAEGLRWPRAACANRALSIQSLRPATSVNRRIMATVDRVTFTWVPAVKRGLRSILRRVSTASPIAHKQKRRMPVSLLGIINV